MQSREKISRRLVQIISFSIAVISVIVALVVFIVNLRTGSGVAPIVSTFTPVGTISVTPTPTVPIVGATRPPIPTSPPDLASLQATMEAQNTRITELENIVSAQSKNIITAQQLQYEIDNLNTKMDLQNKFIDERLASINTTLSWFVPVILTFALSLLTFVGSNALRDWSRRNEGK